MTANSSTDADYSVGLGNMAFQQSGTQIWNFLVQQLKEGEDVEVGMFDHMVTLMGVQTTGGSANTPALAEIIDPNFVSPGGTGQGGMSNGPAGEWVTASYSTYFGLVQLSGSRLAAQATAIRTSTMPLRRVPLRCPNRQRLHCLGCVLPFF